MEIARRHLQPAELRELVALNPDDVTVSVTDAQGKQTEVKDIGALLAALEESRHTVDEPAHHEGTRNQRRVAKKLMRKATKAGKRK